MNARQKVVTPLSLMVVGLLMVLLASLLVFQSQQVSASPADGGTTSLFEPKSGALVMDQAPYVGGILGFVVALLDRIFSRLFTSLGVPPGGGGPGPSPDPSPEPTPDPSPTETPSPFPTSTDFPTPEPTTPAPSVTPTDDGDGELDGRTLAERIRCRVFTALGKEC